MNNLLLIAIIIQSVSVVILCLLYFPLMRGIFKHTQEDETGKDRSLTEARKIILAAQEEAQKIISTAGEVSQDSRAMLKDTLEKLHTLYGQSLSAESDKFLAEYRLALQSTQNKDIQALQKISEDIDITINNYLSEFSDKLNSQTDATIKIVQAEISKELVETQKEINEYKQHRLKQAEDQAGEMVDRVVREVVGKSLSPQKQQELVAAAIKNASAQND